MIKKILDSYKSFDKITCKILRKGLFFCFSICILSTIILLTYILDKHSPFLLELGISVFKLSIIYAIEFIICSFVCDGIKNQLI